MQRSMRCVSCCNNFHAKYGIYVYILIKCAVSLCVIIGAQGGETALTKAVANGHTDTVKLLVEAGASMEAKDLVNLQL